MNKHNVYNSEYIIDDIKKLMDTYTFVTSKKNKMNGLNIKTLKLFYPKYNISSISHSYNEFIAKNIIPIEMKFINESLYNDYIVITNASNIIKRFFKRCKGFVPVVFLIRKYINTQGYRLIPEKYKKDNDKNDKIIYYNSNMLQIFEDIFTIYEKVNDRKLMIIEKFNIRSKIFKGYYIKLTISDRVYLMNQTHILYDTYKIFIQYIIKKKNVQDGMCVICYEETLSCCKSCDKCKNIICFACYNRGISKCPMCREYMCRDSYELNLFLYDGNMMRISEYELQLFLSNNNDEFKIFVQNSSLYNEMELINLLKERYTIYRNTIDLKIQRKCRLLSVTKELEDEKDAIDRWNMMNYAYKYSNDMLKKIFNDEHFELNISNILEFDRNTIDDIVYYCYKKPNGIFKRYDLEMNDSLFYGSKKKITMNKRVLYNCEHNKTIHINNMKNINMDKQLEIKRALYCNKLIVDHIKLITTRKYESQKIFKLRNDGVNNLYSMIKITINKLDPYI